MSAGDMSTSPGLPTPGHALFEELTAGFALDALEPGEEELFLAHLPDCDRCQDALIAHQEVAAALAYALPLGALPAMSEELAACIESRAGQLPLDPFAAAEAAARGGVPVTRAAVTPRRKRGIMARQTRRVLVGAGALGIVAAIGLSGYDVHLRSGTPGSVAGGDQKLLQAISGNGATIAHLSGANATATAVVSGGHAYLVASGLAKTTAKTSYVVWNLGGAGARPTALQHFTASGGTATQVVDLGSSSSAASKSFAVTLENTSVKAPLPTSPSELFVLNQDGRTS